MEFARYGTLRPETIDHMLSKIKPVWQDTIKLKQQILEKEIKVFDQNIILGTLDQTLD